MGGVRSCQSIFKSGSFAPKLSLVIVIHDFGTRNGFKSTKRQTPSSSIDRQLRCLPNLERPMHRGELGFVLRALGAASFLRVWILSNSAIAWFSILFIMASYRIWFSSPSDGRKR